MNKFKFEKLIIWQQAMDFGEDINEISNNFPDKEKYNLSSQMRRAVDSIAFEYFRRLNWTVKSRAEKICWLFNTLFSRSCYLLIQSKKKKLY